MSDRKEFWSDFDGGENRLWHMKRGFTEHIIKEILKYKPKKCLDIGCGSGYYVRELRKRKIDAYGIDISEKAILKAPKPYCKVGNALGLKFKDSLFDFVFAVLLIAHVEDKNKAIGEMRRVLKKKGKLLLVYPNKKSIVSLYTIFSRMKIIHNTFTLDEIKEYLENTGFKIIHTEYLFIGKHKNKLLQLLDIITPRKNAEDILIIAEKK